MPIEIGDPVEVKAKRYLGRLRVQSLKEGVAACIEEERPSWLSPSRINAIRWRGPVEELEKVKL